MASESRRPSQIRLHRSLAALYDTAPGRARLAAVNHTVIGRRFMITALVFFLIGGTLSMLIRAQLATSSSGFLEPELYGQVFTMHGTIMMFLFAIPMFEGFVIYLLPKLLGARDLAFPRLSAYGYWCYLFGGSMLVLSMLVGLAPDGGWFMYTPLSSRSYSPGMNADVWLLGVTFVEISAVCASVELLVTILKIRAPGMDLARMPILAWYMLAVGAMMLIGFPPLILGSILLELERAFDMPFFDPLRGGDPFLWQHLFWLFGHPEVYIIFLPAAGAISTMLPVLAQRPLIGYRAIVVAVVAMAFVSFGLWVHHMFTVGIPHLAMAFFSVASAVVAIPTGIQIFAWLATLAHGRPRYSIPMLYSVGFFVVFVMGGLTGVMVAMVPFDWQVHDTHFVVAHLHYVLFGGFVFPMFAAAYYWLPHFSGARPSHKLAAPAFWLIFLGFNTTFLPMHLTGLKGMPRRVYTYPIEAGWDWLNLASSVGGFVLTIGIALALVDLVLQVRFKRAFRRNPWGAGTLEWAMLTPPPSYNFASLPRIDRRADTIDPRSLGAFLASGRGYLGSTQRGRMETLGVEMVTGQIDCLVLLPRQTFLPLWTALATGGFFVSFLFKQYWMAPIALVAVIVLFWLWTVPCGCRRDMGALSIGAGEEAVTQYETETAPSWWAMVFTLGADATLYVSLLFAGLFLWVSAPHWHAAVPAGPDWPAATAAALSLVVASAAGRKAVASASAGPMAGLSLVACALAQGLAAILLAWMALGGTVDPTSHAYGATTAAILFYAAIHSGLGVVFAAYGFWRTKAGYVSARRRLDLRIAQLWHDYTAGAGLLAIAFAVLLAGLARPSGVSP